MKTNKTIIFAALAAFTSSIASCIKDPVVEPTPAAKTCYINKTITKDTSNTTYPVFTENYEYDANNRIVKITNNNSVATVTYNANTTTIVKVPNTGTNIETTTITTNSVGDVLQKIVGVGSSKDTTKYEYDTNGYPSKEIHTNYTYTFSVVNGNITTVVNTDRITGDVALTILVEHGSQLNKTDLFQPYEKTGKIDKNVVSKVTLNFPNSRQIVVNRTYNFDSEGYITKRTDEQTDTYQSSVTKRGFTDDYTYSCK
jgi:hypothetical protein